MEGCESLERRQDVVDVIVVGLLRLENAKHLSNLSGILIECNHSRIISCQPSHTSCSSSSTEWEKRSVISSMSCERAMSTRFMMVYSSEQRML